MKMRLLTAIKAFLKGWSGDSDLQQSLKIDTADFSHLRLLALLQHSGRLVDFFKEDISDYSDQQVGAAARKIHADCSKSLEELVTIRPVMEDDEGAVVKIHSGYDAASIKVVGKVKGDPPYTGVLTHKGWKAQKLSLPKNSDNTPNQLLAPAEVEVR